MEIDSGQIFQIAITIIGSGVAAYLGVLSRIRKVETFIGDIRLQQVKECEAHREKIYDRINNKVEKAKDEITGVRTIPLRKETK